MAVAAYASVINLLQVLDNIQHPVRRRLLPNPKQIETLQEKLHFLQEFLEATKIEGIKDLVMKQITDAANEAEDIIDSHMVDQLRQEHEYKTDSSRAQVVDGLCEASENKMPSSFCQDLDKVIEKIDKVIEKIDSIKEELVKAEGKAVQEQQPPLVSVRAGSPTLLPSRGNNSTSHVVGFDERLIQIMELLTGGRPNLQIIPIVGMGGIGKTTLARFAFENKCVVEKFDVRVWFTISQEYSAHEILLGVLRDIGVKGDLKNKTSVELRLRLHQELSGRRYLIVMDDLWSTDGWDEFKSSFPNDVNGSRVMVTTRLNDVAVSLASYDPYLMDFLDEDNSWNLFCEKAFIQGSSSPDLEEIGKRIAKGCKGLPLAIAVIGGLLAKSDMTRVYWESVAGKTNLLVSSANDEACSKILFLSYNHLPIHLKPCFLYMGFIREDHEIEVSNLTQSWVVEGFLKPKRGKSLEEVANEYLEDLIGKNLILICQRGSLGEIKRCGVHDLLRDLCQRESQKEHFVRVPKSQVVSFNTPESFLFRELDDFDPPFYELPKSVNGLVNDPKCYHHLLVEFDGYNKELPLYTKLRRLALSTFISLPFVFPSTISQLWNLRTLYTLVLDSQPPHTQVINLPFEIWEMPQLRSIVVSGGYGFNLPIVTQIDRKDFIVLENLHTLVGLNKVTFTEDVVKRIPNLKELQISYAYNKVDWSYYCLHNIANLHKLESLVLHNWKFTCGNIAFPYSLKKLKLIFCIIPWEDMTVIGSLPNLEILVLFQSIDHDPPLWRREWNPVEGEFGQLKFLSFSDSHLEQWRAESIHFPKLEILKLVCMELLKEIPCGIGEIETLRKIELYFCPDSVINSAKEICEEQQSFGNEDLQVEIDGRIR